MLAIITKASSDYYYSFKEVKTIEDILKIAPKVVIKKNPYDKQEVEYWDDFDPNDFEKVEKAKINILIYDDYIE